MEVLILRIASLSAMVARQPLADGLEVGITLFDDGSTLDDGEESSEGEEASP